MVAEFFSWWWELRSSTLLATFKYTIQDCSPESSRGIVRAFCNPSDLRVGRHWHLVGGARDAKHPTRNPWPTTRCQGLRHCNASTTLGVSYKHPARAPLKVFPSAVTCSLGHWPLFPLAPFHYLKCHLLWQALSHSRSWQAYSFTLLYLIFSIHHYARLLFWYVNLLRAGTVYPQHLTMPVT